MKQWILTCAAAIALGAWPAGAGIITGVTDFGGEDGTGPGMGAVTVVVVPAINFNNDNQDGTTPILDNNINVPIKRFDNPGYIDIEFEVTASLGISEYKLTESIDNNTGLPWVGYTMQLGFGTGAGFVPSVSGDGLDFDAPGFDPPPTSAAFSGVAPSEDLLVFSGGSQGAGQAVYNVRIDVPDPLLLVGGKFTLRQLPVPIPEPAGLALAGLGLLGAIVVRGKRRV
jgi:hypothetical protein